MGFVGICGGLMSCELFRSVWSYVGDLMKCTGSIGICRD